MRPDLDSMFDALAARADQIPAPTERAVRARGNRRRLVHRTATAVAACLTTGALAVGATVYSGVIGDDVPAAGFTTLVEVGPRRDGGQLTSGGTIALMSGDNGILATQRPFAGIAFTAVDLRTGAVRWRSYVEDPNVAGARISVAPAGVVVVSGANLAAQHTITVLDPASGRQFWHLLVDLDLDAMELYRSVLVYSSRTDSTLTALDVRTGGTLWRVPFAPGDRLVPVRAEAELDGPGRTDIDGGVAYDADRVLAVNAAGQLRVLDVHTGRLLASGEVAPDAQGSLPPVGDGPSYHAIDQRLYLATGTDRFQVRAYDLATGLDLGTVYRSEPGRTFAVMATCGGQRLCVLEDGPTGTVVAAVDLGTRREAWRRPAPAAKALLPVGDGILATGGIATLYLDGNGRDLLGNTNVGTGAARTDAAGALLYRQLPQGTVLEGVSASGTRTRLGQVPADMETCAWNAQVILCPTTEEYGLWRFTN